MAPVYTHQKAAPHLTQIDGRSRVVMSPVRVGGTAGLRLPGDA